MAIINTRECGSIKLIMPLDKMTFTRILPYIRHAKIRNGIHYLIGHNGGSILIILVILVIRGEKFQIPRSETGLPMCVDSHSSVAQGNLDWCMTGGPPESRLGRESARSSAAGRGSSAPNSNFLSLSSVST